jgi:hypothetical protein
MEHEAKERQRGPGKKVAKECATLNGKASEAPQEQENCHDRKRQRSAEETGDQVAPPEKEAGQEQSRGEADQEKVTVGVGKPGATTRQTKMHALV